MHKAGPILPSSEVSSGFNFNLRSPKCRNRVRKPFVPYQERVSGPFKDFCAVLERPIEEGACWWVSFFFYRRTFPLTSLLAQFQCKAAAPLPLQTQHCLRESRTHCDGARDDKLKPVIHIADRQFCLLFSTSRQSWKRFETSSVIMPVTVRPYILFILFFD